MSTAIAGWQKEREAKKKQKEFANRGNEHSEWQNQRDVMNQKKREAELQAQQKEANAPEFMKKRELMKEKAASKPKGESTTGPREPTIEELDDGTDIPPWKRSGAPEKPEWVKLLLQAAVKKAEEDDDDEIGADGHVFAVAAQAASTSSTTTTTRNDEPVKSKTTNDDQPPEWMKQASNLKSPLTPRVLKPTRTVVTSKAILPVQLTSDKQDNDKPEWMKNAAKLKKTKTPPPLTPPQASSSPSSSLLPTEEPKSPNTDIGKPAWMSKLKQKQKTKAAPLTIDASQKGGENENDDNEVDNNDQPAWMKHASKIKQQAPLLNESTTTEQPSSATNSTSDQKGEGDNEDGDQDARMKNGTKNKEQQQTLPVHESTANEQQSSSSTITRRDEQDKDEDGKQPAWMKHKLKPRVSVKDLQSNKVQEKLDQKSPLRKSSVVMSISKTELQQNIVKEKLAKQQQSLRGELKKSPLKKGEMEWMKAKLKKIKPQNDNGGKSLDAPTTLNNTETDVDVNQAVAVESDDDNDGKAKSDDKDVPSDDKDEDDDGNKLEWMKKKLKSRASIHPKDLQSSSVQLKLGQKQPLRKSSLVLSREELVSNKVTSKLKQRPSMLDQKKSRLKKEDMAMTKQKLKPAVKTKDDKSDRPKWMKQVQRRIVDSESTSESDAASIGSSAPKAKDTDTSDSRPQWLIETQRRGSFRGLGTDSESKTPPKSLLNDSQKSKEEIMDDSSKESQLIPKVRQEDSNPQESKEIVNAVKDSFNEQPQLLLESAKAVIEAVSGGTPPTDCCDGSNAKVTPIASSTSEPTDNVEEAVDSGARNSGKDWWERPEPSFAWLTPEGLKAASPSRNLLAQEDFWGILGTEGGGDKLNVTDITSGGRGRERDSNENFAVSMSKTVTALDPVAIMTSEPSSARSRSRSRKSRSLSKPRSKSKNGRSKSRSSKRTKDEKKEEKKAKKEKKKDKKKDKEKKLEQT